MGQAVSAGLPKPFQRSTKSIGMAKQSNVNDSCSSWADDLLSDLGLEVDRASHQIERSGTNTFEQIVEIDDDASSSWIDLSDEEDDTIEQIVDEYSKMSASTLHPISTEPAQEDLSSTKLMDSISESTLGVEESIEALAQQMDAILSYHEMDSATISDVTQEPLNAENPTLFSRLEKIAQNQRQNLERVQALTEERDNWKTFALRRGKILDANRKLKSLDLLDSSGRQTRQGSDDDIHNCQVCEVARLYVQVRRLESENRAVMRDRSEAFKKLKGMLNGVQDAVEKI